MIVKLVMKCWRQHEEREVSFTPGLNSIRGANEGGKTGLLLAIVYALWGSRLMPLPMEEMCTWGRNAKDLRVDLTVSIGGQLYLFTRGPSGAECRHGGGVVTGQNEVSRFASELLGVDMGMAEKILFAPQTRMRGALEAGPKELSQYIESMSGMDLFERIVTLAGDKWPTGPTTNLDGQISTLEEEVAKGEPPEPDFTQVENDLSSWHSTLHTERGSLVNLEADLARTSKELTQAEERQKQYEAKKRDLQAAVGRQETRRRQVVQHQADIDAALDIDLVELEERHILLKAAESAKPRMEAFTKYSSLKYPEVFWEGDSDSLQAEIVREVDEGRRCSDRVKELQADIREAKAKVITSSVCGFCKQDMSQFPEVAENNARLEALIAQKTQEWTAQAKAVAACARAEADLRDVHVSAKPLTQFIASYGQYVKVDDNFVPPKVAWIGPVPTMATDIASTKAEIVRMEGVLQKAKAAEGLRDQMLEVIEAEDERIKAMPSEELEPVDLGKYEEAREAVKALGLACKEQIDAAAAIINRLGLQKRDMMGRWERAKERFETQQDALKKAKSLRDDLVFYNALIKKIRAARPKVAAKLWEVVLTSVSQMFSNMRGEMSVVAKSDKTFTVNGQPYQALSGSAMDLLGLAIRVAMLKTFVPNCGFIILDEPMAACDGNRSAAMLGFIASCGFEQVVLVSHEDVVDAVADNLVMI